MTLDEFDKTYSAAEITKRFVAELGIALGSSTKEEVSREVLRNLPIPVAEMLGIPEAFYYASITR